MKEILDNIVKYLKTKIPNLKTDGALFTCPVCEERDETPSCTIEDEKIRCVKCGFVGNVFELFNKFHGYSWDNDEITEEIARTLGLKIKKENYDDILEFYKENNFDLVPVVAGKKAPPIEGDFWNQKHTELSQWKGWLKDRVNFGIKTGHYSNVTVLDFDDSGIPEEILKLKGEPLIEKTKRGFHYYYKYEKDLPDVNLQDPHLEILNGKHYSFCTPSIADGYRREFITDLKLTEMPKGLKKYLLKLTKNEKKIVKKEDNKTTKLKEDIETGNFKINHKDLELKNNNLEGCCNGSFIRFGGVVRKKLCRDDTSFVMHLFNKYLLANPMKHQEVNAMLNSLEKYRSVDNNELNEKIIKYMKIAEEVTSKDLQEVLSEKKIVIDNALSYLVKEKYLIRRGRGRGSYYKLIKKMEWKTKFMDEGGEVDYKLPYIHDYAVVRNSDLIIIGGLKGSGKCITNGMLLTNQGFMDIEDIGKNKQVGTSKITKHIRINSGGYKDKAYRHPNYFYKEKVNHTIKIKTSHGYEIEGTPEHPIKIVEGKKNRFEKLSNIKERNHALIVVGGRFPRDDLHDRDFFNYVRLKMDRCSKKINIPKRMTKDLAKFFGFVIGDGSVQHNCVSIYQNIKEKTNIDEIDRLVNKFGLTTKKTVKDNCIKIMIFSAVLSNLIRLKCFKSKKRKGNLISPLREVPKCVLKGSKEIQLNFISALFSCESSLSAGRIDITMASKKMIKQLHIMLLNLGIISKLSEKKVKKYPENIYYRITIPKGMTNKFFELIIPDKYKEVKLTKLKLDYLSRYFIGNNKVLKDYYFKDEIVSIEHCYDEKYVYDFNIEGSKYNINNQFWCNGFVNHNTHVAANIIKRLKEQDIKPYYISLEGTSRFFSIVKQLGLKEEDFKFNINFNPLEIELEENSITILDWLLPDDYAQTDKLYKYFSEQLSIKGGVLIIFVQLKKDKEWFAPSMIEMFPAVAIKFLYDDEKSGTTSSFLFTKRREPRKFEDAKQLRIPSYYDIETKELKLEEERQNGDGNRQDKKS